MAKMKTEEQPVVSPVEPPVETKAELVPATDFKSLFAREVNAKHPIKSVKMARTLTRPLIAMTYEKRLLFQCSGEMYIMTLKGKGRSADFAPARVVDGTAFRVDKDGNQTSEECTLIFNEMMVGGLEHGGFRVLAVPETEQEGVDYVEKGTTSITGRAFAFQLANVNEDKGYRVIDVREVSIER